jgi:hypothetical protein
MMLSASAAGDGVTPNLIIIDERPFRYLALAGSELEDPTAFFWILKTMLVA